MLIREIETATAAMRWNMSAERLAAALRRAVLLERRYNFDPAQPRLPRGVSGGGRWTDGGGLPAGTGGALDDGRGPRPPGQGPRFAQARGGRTPPQRVSVDVGGGMRLPATPVQQARFEAARLWADWQIARVRSVDPRWKPQPGVYGTIEGAIRQQQGILAQGDAYLRSRLRGIGDNGGPPLDMPPSVPSVSPVQVLAPGGRALGFRATGAGPNIYTVSAVDFDASLLLLTNGRQERIPTNSYPGVYYDLPDRCVIGVRVSEKNGLTIEVIETGTRLPLRSKTKFHRR